MRKIIMSLILIFTICMMGNVYAALNCSMSVQVNKSEVNKNEEFTMNVNVANIQSEKGIIALQANLDYDKESLELIRMTGKNGWETPTDGATYNAATGKIVINRSGPGKNAETVFTVTFRVKEASKQNLTVGLRNIKVADGTKPISLPQAYQSVTIATGTQNPIPQPKPDEPEVNPNPGTSGGSSSTGSSSSNSVGTTNTTKKVANKSPMTNGKLPKAGNDNMMFLSVIGLVSIVAIVFFLKIKLVNKKMGL